MMRQMSRSQIPAGQAAASQSLTSVSDTGTRLDITAPLVTGSVSTMGARIDDLILTSYSQS